MARFSAMINQFNGGYMSQRMNARTNLENWPSYLKDSCNFIPTVWGGNKFRNGTKFVAETQKSHFIPFIFNNSIAYVVEFCDGFCRFYRDGAPVLTDEGETLIIDSPYSYDSITGANGECLIKKQQSADVMYIATGRHPLYKLLRTAENKFEFISPNLKNGPYGDKIFLPSLEYSVEKTDSQNLIFKFVGSTASTGFMAFNSGGTSGGIIDSHYFIELKIDDEFILDDVDYGSNSGGAPDAIVNFFNSNDYGFYLKYDTAISAPASFETMQAYSRPNRAVDFYGKKIYLRIHWKLLTGFRELTWEGKFEDMPSSQILNFDSSHLGSNIRISFSRENIAEWSAGATVTPTMSSDNKFYSYYSGSTTTGNRKPVHTKGIVSDGKVNWRFLNFGYADGKIVEIVNKNEIKIFFEEEVFPLSNNIDWVQLGIFSNEGNKYPTSVFYFKERLGLTIAGGHVPQIAFSQTGDYENFDPLVEGEVVDESAILSDLVVGEIDVVNWGVGLDDVLLATESNFLLVSPATTAENFSPTNIKIDYISSNGAGKISPVIYGDAVVYLDEKNTSLFTNGYYWESDGYKTAKISWPAEDLFEGGIKGIAYQKDPDSCFWILTQAGDLISLVYEQTQNVSAFSFHATDGEVQTICCIPSSDGKREELWLNVKRVLPDGTVKYFVEVMQDNSYRNSIWAANRKSVSTENYELAKDNIKKTFWYVDCGVKKESENLFSEIDGLGHLEGKTLVGLADGRYVNDLVVKDGKVELGTECNYAIVGLPYEGYFVPNSINAGAQAGASQGKVQRVHSATIRVFRSRDFKCGDGVRMKDVIVSRNGVAGEGVLTGDVRIAFPGTYSNRYSEDTSAEIVIKQDKPYPLCVNGLILDMETYDA